MIDYRQEYIKKVRRPQWRPLSAVKHICIHHPAAAQCSVDRLLSYFAGNKLGYHVYIRRNGATYWLAGWDRVMYANGAGKRSKHGAFSEYNWTQIAVSLEGMLIDGAEPTEAQFTAIQAVIAEIWAALGRRVPVRGHKDFTATQCPGDWWTKGMVDPRVLPK